ncbi:MAG: glycerophosphodiester phosphodiesterase family protein [Candidatus Thioglobus sp.]
MQKRTYIKPMIVAHRGASGDAPENTLASFSLAWQQDADAIEGDFHLTSDGHIVCIHDSDTNRVSGTRLVINKSTLKELQELDIGSHFGDKFCNERIATIEQVFDTVPSDKKILVEIKCSEEIVPILLDKIKLSRLDLSQIIIISFDQKIIKKCKIIEPKLVSLWLHDFFHNNDIEFIISTLLDIRADGLSSNNTSVEVLASKVIGLGLSYHSGWTMDDIGVINKTISWGAQSITTNNPGKIKNKLLSNRAQIE